MVAPAIGAALMRAGGSIAGSSAARSAAGSILRTGGQGGFKAGEITGALKELTKVSKNISDKVKKIVAVLEKASPALRQQLTVLRKSFEVFLRPIGDILAKFLRPMALWFLKIAVLWYKWLGGKAGLGGETADELEQAKEQREVAVEEGNTSEVDRLDKVIAALEAGTTTTEGSGYSGQKTIGDDIWENVIPESFKDTLELLKQTWADFLKVLEPLKEPLKIVFGVIGETLKILGGALLTGALWALNGALVVVDVALKGIIGIWNTFKATMDLLGIAMKALGSWIGDKFGAFFTETIPGFFEDMKTKLKTIWDSIVNWFKNFNWRSLIPSWMGGKKDGESHAVGGEISQTGLYKLHAGERVLTAGDNSRTKSGNNINVTNNITLNPTINTDMDIRKLAQKLASYNETQLRRRVSYI